MGDTKKKVVVIGLDGSSWDLVGPLMDNGRLPNISRMVDKGMSTMMESTNPAHSAPAWTTFVTGVQPTEHGCLDFLTVDKDIDDLQLIDSTKIPQETIYEAMKRHGRKPILINLPNTYPPRLKNTTTITSLMTRGDDFIFPTNLKEKYPALNDYRLSPNPKLRMKDNFDPYVKDLCELERKRIAASKEIFEGEDWDFFFYLSSGTDWVSHVVYDKALLEQYEPALQMWEIMDEYIGWIMNKLDDDTILYVMSDHGFRVYDHIFYVNRWLEQQGYLSTKEGTGSFHKDHTQLSKEISKAQKKRKEIKVGKGLRSFLSASPTLEKIAKWIYFKIIKKFIPITVTLDLQLDLENTKVAFPRGSMATMLYINNKERFTKGTVTQEEREELQQKLVDELQAVRDSAGEPAVRKVMKKEDVYGESGIPTAPDVFLQPGKYYLSGSLHSSSVYENVRKNYHDERGMFIAYGNDIDHRDMNDTHIIHMAPTILHSMGLPLQDHFTGSVMDIYSQHSPLQNPSEKESFGDHHALNTLIDDIDV